MYGFMSNLQTRIRNYFDYIIYGFKLKEIGAVSLCIDIGILIYAIVDIKNLFIVDNPWWVLLIIIFINVIWQFVSIVKEYISFFSRGSRCIKINDYKTHEYLIEDELKTNYRLIEIKEIKKSILISDVANDIIRHQSVSCTYFRNKKKRKTDKYILINKYILVKFLNWEWIEMRRNKGAFFNEKKLCMAGELFEKAKDDASYSVPICKGYYYNSFLTNNAYTITLYEDGFKIHAPLNIYNYHIQTLDKSIMSDHIGVSTLAISCDNYIFILIHNNKTVVSSNKLQPSGSGSVDFRDWKHDNDFKSIIRRAAERELVEETRLPKTCIKNTEITGFYRDLSRAGKPEFCCVTHMISSKNEIEELIRPNESEIVCESQEPIQINKIKEYIDNHTNEVSLSLYMSLFMLNDYKTHSPSVKDSVCR